MLAGLHRACTPTPTTISLLPLKEQQMPVVAVIGPWRYLRGQLAAVGLLEGSHLLSGAYNTQDAGLYCSQQGDRLVLFVRPTEADYGAAGKEQLSMMRTLIMAAIRLCDSLVVVAGEEDIPKSRKAKQKSKGVETASSGSTRTTKFFVDESKDVESSIRLLPGLKDFQLEGTSDAELCGKSELAWLTSETTERRVSAGEPKKLRLASRKLEEKLRTWRKRCKLSFHKAVSKIDAVAILAKAGIEIPEARWGKLEAALHAVDVESRQASRELGEGLTALLLGCLLRRAIELHYPLFYRNWQPPPLATEELEPEDIAFINGCLLSDRCKSCLGQVFAETKRFIDGHSATKKWRSRIRRFFVKLTTAESERWREKTKTLLSRPISDEEARWWQESTLSGQLAAKNPMEAVFRRAVDKHVFKRQISIENDADERRARMEEAGFGDMLSTMLAAQRAADSGKPTLEILSYRGPVRQRASVLNDLHTLVYRKAPTMQVCCAYTIRYAAMSRDDKDALLKDPLRCAVPRTWSIHSPPRLVLRSNMRLRGLHLQLQRCSILALVELLDEGGKSSGLQVHVQPWSKSELSTPVKTFPNGFAAVDYDPYDRMLVLASRGKVLAARFTSSKLEKLVTLAQVDLAAAGVPDVAKVHALPFCRQAVVVDSNGCCRVFEIASKNISRSSYTLPAGAQRTLVTPDSSMLLVLRLQSASGSFVTDAADAVSVCVTAVELPQLTEVYAEPVPLTMPPHAVNSARVVTVSSQFQLVWQTADLRHCNSSVLDISSTRASATLRALDRGVPEEEEKSVDEVQKPYPLSYPRGVLQLLIDCWARFATVPSLSIKRASAEEHKSSGAASDGEDTDSDSDLDSEAAVHGAAQLTLPVSVFLAASSADGVSDKLVARCKRRLVGELDFMFESTRKPRTLQVDLAVHPLEASCSALLGAGAESPRARCSLQRRMQELILLIPLQIARAYGNQLKHVQNGLLQAATEARYTDRTELVAATRFGLVDCVLQEWNGDIRVISSMGKQSTGKSYTLNHLTGSLFNIAGGRCTDGVWMCARVVDDNSLVIVLDFEGLGSIERTKQEDMFLSVMNSCVSDFTIFKTEQRLDGDTMDMLRRFREGVELISGNPDFLRGSFNIVVKDVVTSPDEVGTELSSKIGRLLADDSKNFISMMYGGQLSITCFPTLATPAFYAEMDRLWQQVMESVSPRFTVGAECLNSIKLAIATIELQDWTSMTSSATHAAILFLQANLSSALNTGLVTKDGSPQPLADRSGAPIPDRELPLATKRHLPDEGLPLLFSDDFLFADDFILQEEDMRKSDVSVWDAREWFEEYVQSWQKTADCARLFGEFLQAILARRRERLEAWFAAYTAGLEDEVLLVSFQATLQQGIRNMEHRWQLCSSKSNVCCKDCALPCVLAAGHSSWHCCGTDHICDERCTYCAEDGIRALCALPAGHSGSHNCHSEEREHTCTKLCASAAAAGCQRACALEPEHDGDCQCASPAHSCGQSCTATNCSHPCTVPWGITHDHCDCGRASCEVLCSFGCGRTCSRAHHHDAAEGHLCAHSHPCPKECQEPGYCEIVTTSVAHEAFTGQKSAFTFSSSDQDGKKHVCVRTIPAGQTEHEGRCTHSLSSHAIHFCDTRCPTCSYICSLPYGHAGRHATQHGSMRGVYAGDEFMKDGNMICAGDSARPEMCPSFCRSRGRGHTHLSFCPDPMHCPAEAEDGKRHEVHPLEPFPLNAKDEYMHSVFWEMLNFEDPCSPAEQASFRKCGAMCDHASHEDRTGVPYCTLDLWHDDSAVAGVGQSVLLPGHHLVGCTHHDTIPLHTILLLDRSSSMTWGKYKPQDPAAKHQNEWGLVLEAVTAFVGMRMSTHADDRISIVAFNSVPFVVKAVSPLTTAVAHSADAMEACGGTNFGPALQTAAELIVAGGGDRNPMILFLTDGGDNGSDAMIGIESVLLSASEIGRPLRMHCISFGEDAEHGLLQAMVARVVGYAKDRKREGEPASSFAEASSHVKTLDDIQLHRAFQAAAKLKDLVAVVMA
eukprot:PLAT10991.1.p1 GENE.PLAT10991.1~~PLAT10991.1.p1  ORF type:complete len:2165 (-),score=254.05 PLAT10991.1:298-6390(-)